MMHVTSSTTLLYLASCMQMIESYTFVMLQRLQRISRCCWQHVPEECCIIATYCSRSPTMTSRVGQTSRTSVVDERKGISVTRVSFLSWFSSNLTETWVLLFIFIMKSCTKHTKKKIKYNRLDNHAGLQVSTNCLVCADIYNKCMKFFAIKINVIRKN